MAVSTVICRINGQDYTLTKNSSTGMYEATITAPNMSSGMNTGGVGPGIGAEASGKGYYPITITATDTAGNMSSIDDTDPTHGAACRLMVKETIPPSASIVYPGASATLISNRPTIQYAVSDTGSGVNPSSCRIQIDDGGEVSVPLSGGGATFEGSFTAPSALNDGVHVVRVYAYDNDGNRSNIAESTFRIDTAPPVLNVASPVDGLVTNEPYMTVRGTTNDATSSPVSVTIEFNEEGAQSVDVQSDGTFSREWAMREGENVFIIRSTDGAGNTSTVTRRVVLDPQPPRFYDPQITPNPTETGMQYIISIEVFD